MSSPFYNARLVEWRAQVATWPTIITANGLSATVIRTPDHLWRVLELTNYVDKIATTVDMLRDESDGLNIGSYAELHLALLKTFKATVSGKEYNYLITEMLNDDANEPTVQFRAVRVL